MIVQHATPLGEKFDKKAPANSSPPALDTVQVERVCLSPLSRLMIKFS